MSDELGELELRELEEGDVPSLLDLLRHLTDAPAVTTSALRAIAEARRQAGMVTRVFIHRPTRRVVGTASLFVEPKFSRGGKSVGHIEDVVVDPSYRGKKLGQALIGDLCNIARSRGCYKVILDCAEAAIEFYKKLGFEARERQMRLDL
ncbi:putative glucosamine 6-phosphate n-acetyltransferase [Trypanosoma cruzi]|uniref:Glucosamine 6-phosphate N-acetyltransferase n=2 Tax=Trypanosoma cruzi TaxID=5693 RepID=Q4DGL9_TRYCC|nr:acetyltransferase, putative [Trypanosoma cruzi]EAN91666.1 acetyltransferase, putative [Trypanosoma cruzi]PWV06926.1 putative glucosamine 6-phosphate n-acetyltransferase [Trypanosoma cruzi]RNC44592.1 acetyltransferase [Trypanosoma cruzi]|eukprot:XP_813517.1 acetyltransferase [Trypanosoma cruzi strain CL Brener]